MNPPPPERPPNLAKVVAEIREELATEEPLPPGDMRFSLMRTHRFQRESLQTLLEYYERFGPIFSFRSLHRRIVAMIGPEANHFVTVTGAQNFSWRKGMFGEQLSPLIGDGLITTDWEYHDRARQIMMPAFHRRRMDRAVDVMVQEAMRAIEPWRVGETLDVYEWVRDLAMSISMRAVAGLDPHSGSLGHEAAVRFERALSFYDAESWTTLLRGPGTPWAKMQAARASLDELIYAEIERRRQSGRSGDDVLSMLLDAHDDAGEGFTDRELRDQLMHLLFGGHDTTSSTLSFALYELSRHPGILARLRAEQGAVLDGHGPTAEQLLNEMPYLEMVVDEALRLYPPVWFGPRMSVKPFEFGGYHVPAGVHVIHSSWVSHRLPEVFPNPEAFIPERFAQENKRQLAPGAYIPFGGGQRICIGKRFGQLLVKSVLSTVLARFSLECKPGYELRVAKVPTLSPEGGLPMMIRSAPQLAPSRDTVLAT